MAKTVFPFDKTSRDPPFANPLLFDYFYHVKNASEPHTVKEALAKLMRFCVYRERCHKEVREKLWKLHIDPQEQDYIIARLIAENYLNEERFAKTFVRDKFHLKKWGRFRLKSELQRREISAYLIKKAIDQIDEADYKNTFRQVLEKRLRSISATHPLKIKKKVTDHLLRKGYEADMIYKALDELEG